MVAPAGSGPAEVVPPPKKEMKEKEGTAAPNTARVIVQLPADAKLFIDDHAMKTNGERRSFNTPALDRGQAYYYMVRAEVVRDGKTYSETKRLIVRAGQVANTDFPVAELVKAENETPNAVAAR
jgi:uncharacterized protein (TIGR03000 family)